MRTSSRLEEGLPTNREKLLALALYLDAIVRGSKVGPPGLQRQGDFGAALAELLGFTSLAALARSTEAAYAACRVGGIAIPTINDVLDMQCFHIIDSLIDIPETLK